MGVTQAIKTSGNTLNSHVFSPVAHEWRQCQYHPSAVKLFDEVLALKVSFSSRLVFGIPEPQTPSVRTAPQSHAPDCQKLFAVLLLHELLTISRGSTVAQGMMSISAGFWWDNWRNIKESIAEQSAKSSLRFLVLVKHFKCFWASGFAWAVESNLNTWKVQHLIELLLTVRHGLLYVLPEPQERHAHVWSH